MTPVLYIALVATLAPLLRLIWDCLLLDNAIESVEGSTA